MNSQIEKIAQLAEEIAVEPHRTSLLNSDGVIKWHQLYTDVDREKDFYVLRPDLPRLAHSRGSIDGKVYPYDKRPSALRYLAKAAGVIKGHDISVSKNFDRVSKDLRIFRDLIPSDWELMAYFNQYWFEGTLRVDETDYEFNPDISFIRADIGRSDGTTGGMGWNWVSFTARPFLEEVTSTGKPEKVWEGQKPLPMVDYEATNEENMIRVLQSIISNTSTPQ